MDWLAGFDPMIAATRVSALWFLPFAVPISAYVVWMDLKSMRIANRTVILLFACFVVIGPLALPLPEYGWRLAQAAIVLFVGFLVHLLGGIGAGDVKFVAAAAPLVPAQDGQLLLLIVAAALMAAFVTHRTARAIPALRGLAPDWLSWTRRDFPMGFALGVSLVVYLVLAAIWGR